MVWVFALAAVLVAAIILWGMLSRKPANVRDGPSDRPGETKPDSGGPAENADFIPGEKSSVVKRPFDQEPISIADQLSAWLLGGSPPTKRPVRGMPPDISGGQKAPETPASIHSKLDEFLETNAGHVLPPEGLKLLITATEDRWRPFIITACYTGMRAIELFGLTWEDIDFIGNRINIERTYFDGRFHDPKPKGAKRSIIVPRIVIEALEEHRDQQRNAQIETAHYFVFTDSVGKGLELRPVIRNVFKPAIEHAGLSYISFDDVRRSYAATLLAAEKDKDFVLAQLGYEATGAASIRRMMSPADQAAASKRLARIFRTDAVSPRRTA